MGVLKKGDREADKWPNDEYFYPVYEEAQRLDMPICFHVGSGVPDFTPSREFSFGRFIRIGMPAVHAFHSFILHGVPDKFPTLRFGFIEANSSWVPFVLYDLQRRLKTRQKTDNVMSGPAYDMPDDVLKKNRLYVTIQVDEDLPYIVRHTGIDNLLVGSDYTHADASMELEFTKRLQERVDQGDLPEGAVQKIVYDNPKTFYAL